MAQKCSASADQGRKQLALHQIYSMDSDKSLILRLCCSNKTGLSCKAIMGVTLSLKIGRLITMPLYEFVCQECGNQFEKVVSFTATTAPACTACESNEVKRKMSAPAIHFKGSGWYITDSKKSSSTAEKQAA